MAQRRNTTFYGRDTFLPVDIDSGSIPNHQHSSIVKSIPDSSVHQLRK